MITISRMHTHRCTTFVCLLRYDRRVVLYYSWNITYLLLLVFLRRHQALFRFRHQLSTCEALCLR